MSIGTWTVKLIESPPKVITLTLGALPYTGDNDLLIVDSDTGVNVIFAADIATTPFTDLTRAQTLLGKQQLEDALGGLPAAVEAADFDGDGDIDLFFCTPTSLTCFMHWGYQLQNGQFGVIEQNVPSITAFPAPVAGGNCANSWMAGGYVDVTGSFCCATSSCMTKDGITCFRRWGTRHRLHLSVLQ